MKLPNDLIKATDYSKAKDREIHEFEYRKGKYIHKYVLGGEHELTPQEIIDCLNGLATIDCDLQTAYAYIKGQQEQLALTEKALELACKEITSSCEYCSYKTRIECPVEANCLDEKINYFKTEAKEMMKSE